MRMYVGPSKQVMSAFFGPPRQSAAEANIYEALSKKYAGTIAPDAAGGPNSYVATLLDLSKTDGSGQSMFDVLAMESYVRDAVFGVIKSGDKLA